MRALLAWLNKRFPEVVTVTKQDYTELRQEVADLNRYIQVLGQMETRIKNLENLNGFQPTKTGSFHLER